MKVYTDHSAVKTILQTPSANSKHARWWSKIFSSGISCVEIVYRTAKDNLAADAVSRSPLQNAADVELHWCRYTTPPRLSLQATCTEGVVGSGEFIIEQKRDPDLAALIQYLETGELPTGSIDACRIVTLEPFTVESGILVRLNPKNNSKQVVVPTHLRYLVMEQNHGGLMTGHFSGNRLYNTLVRKWWWSSMYKDTANHCKSCAQCATVSGVEAH